MAITVGTEGPKLALAIADAKSHAVKVAASHPSSDASRVIEVLNYMTSLTTALTANNDTTFDAVFTETTIA